MTSHWGIRAFVSTRFIFAASLALPVTAIPASARVQPAPTPFPAFLKLGQFYVIYTNPIVPRPEGRGDFLVGLSAMALLLGAKIAPEHPASSVTLSLAGRSVKFTDSSRTALVNGRPFCMARAATLDPSSYEMLVSLSPLIRAFHLRSRWDPRSRTLSLPGIKVVNSYNSDSIGHVYSELPSPGSVALCPTAVEVTPSTSAIGRPPSRDGEADLRVVVKNVSRRTIPSGRIFINLLIADNYQRAAHPSTLEENINANQIGYLLQGSPGPLFHYYANPALGPGKTRTTALLPGLNSQSSPGVVAPNKTVYVLAWLVVSKVSNRPTNGGRLY